MRTAQIWPDLRLLSYDLTVVLSICCNQLSRVYLLAFKCSCSNKDCQIPKRVCVVVYHAGNKKNQGRKCHITAVK